MARFLKIEILIEVLSRRFYDGLTIGMWRWRRRRRRTIHASFGSAILLAVDPGVGCGENLEAGFRNQSRGVVDRYLEYEIGQCDQAHNPTDCGRDRHDCSVSRLGHSFRKQCREAGRGERKRNRHQREGQREGSVPYVLVKLGHDLAYINGRCREEDRDAQSHGRDREEEGYAIGDPKDLHPGIAERLRRDLQPSGERDPGRQCGGHEYGMHYLDIHLPVLPQLLIVSSEFRLVL